MIKKNFKISDAVKLYGLENWGGGYFDINKQGNLTVKPNRDEVKSVDLKEIIDDLVRKKTKFPVNLRFGQILSDRVNVINKCFKNAINEFEYEADYLGVYPMKVNHRREVVEEILLSGSKYSMGIEVGSKPELAIVLSFNLHKKSLIICNGYKDRAFIEQAIFGKMLGHNIILVIEKMSELITLLKLAKNRESIPNIGVRMKLYSKGTGKWEKSGGEYSKFGFTTMQLLDTIEILKKNNLLDIFMMLHFHIGSQITDIRSVKGAIKEAARVYAKLHKMNIPIKYLNVGGGLGVDYDGSKTTFDSSANYAPQEYANDIVYAIADVCESEDVDVPIIVTECGRALTAFHSIIVAPVNDIIFSPPAKRKISLSDSESAVIHELSDIFKMITRKNYREYYHDALHHKDEMMTMFNLGLLNLEERAKGEYFFREICIKVANFLKEKPRYIPEEFEDLDRILALKYVLNFSVFQSTPDIWAIDQLFPIMPIHRLNEYPSEVATLVDITCDSDGKIDKFIDLRDVNQILNLHTLKSEPYYLGILLTGAYQDILGDLHNLFGRVTDVYVFLDDTGNFHFTRIIKGDTISNVISQADYNVESLSKNFEQKVLSAVKKSNMSENQGKKLILRYNKLLTDFTYLEK